VVERTATHAALIPWPLTWHQRRPGHHALLARPAVRSGHSPRAISTLAVPASSEKLQEAFLPRARPRRTPVLIALSAEVHLGGDVQASVGWLPRWPAGRKPIKAPNPGDGLYAQACNVLGQGRGQGACGCDRDSGRGRGWLGGTPACRNGSPGDWNPPCLEALHREAVNAEQINTSTGANRLPWLLASSIPYGPGSARRAGTLRRSAQAAADDDHLNRHAVRRWSKPVLTRASAKLRTMSCSSLPAPLGSLSATDLCSPLRFCFAELRQLPGCWAGDGFARGRDPHAQRAIEAESWPSMPRWEGIRSCLGLPGLASAPGPSGVRTTN